MIVLDGSTLFAIMLGEPEAEHCKKAIERADELLLSAASLTEILVVATRKGILDRARPLVERLDPEVIPLTHDRALAAGEAFERWGTSPASRRARLRRQLRVRAREEVRLPIAVHRQRLFANRHTIGGARFAVISPSSQT